MKKIIKIIGILILLLMINLIVYIFHTQFVADNKINNKKELNIYEVLSALEFHTCSWLFGWVISPNIAQMCFSKQFNIQDPYWITTLPEDDTTKKAELLSKETNKSIRLVWNNYSSNASILLNGGYVKPFIKNNQIEGYCYDWNCDYKPGIITIGPLKISETVLDYLENKNYLYPLICHRIKPLKHIYLDKQS